MDLLKFATNLETIDPWQVLLPILIKNLNRIEELNKQQLREGIMADGSGTPSHSSSEMSEIYVDMKIEKGRYNESIYPSMNFYNEGDFYNGIKARMDLFGIEIESIDSKAKELESNFGSELYGLTDKSIELLIDPIMPEYIEALTNKILQD